MKVNKHWGGGAAVLAAVAFFTVLLATHLIGEATFAFGMLLVVGAGLVLLFRDRVLELNLKLTELKVVLQKAEEVKAEIKEMYGAIHTLNREPFVLDETKQKELGLGKGGGLVFGATLMRYVAGAMRRERERLAQIFFNEKKSEQLARALIDKSKDEMVFKFRGPEVSLDVPLAPADKEAQAVAESGNEPPNGTPNSQ
jgi:hypothetical protein